MSEKKEFFITEAVDEFKNLCKLIYEKDNSISTEQISKVAIDIFERDYLIYENAHKEKKVREEKTDDNGQIYTIESYKVVDHKIYKSFSQIFGQYPERQCRLLAAEAINEDCRFDYVKLEHKPNKKYFLKACSKIGANWEAYSLGSSATAIRRVVENIHCIIGTEGAKPQQTMGYLYSAIGGTGKGTLMKRFAKWAESRNIPFVKNVKLKTQWQDDKYLRNPLVLVDEFFPPKNNETDFIELINNIIDNTEYTVERKGKDPFSLKSNATIICGSNRLPFDDNQRRYSIVRYNNYRLANKTLSKQEQVLLYYNYTDEEWNEVFDDLFKYCPFGENFDDLVKKVSNNTDELVNMVNEIMPFNGIKECTISTFAKEYCAQIGIVDLSTKKGIKQGIITKVLELVNEGTIKPVHKINGKLEYSTYDFDKIGQLATNETEVKQYLIDETMNDLQATRKVWEYMIYNLDSEEPEKDKNMEPTETSKKVIDKLEKIKYTLTDSLWNCLKQNLLGEKEVFNILDIFLETDEKGIENISNIITVMQKVRDELEENDWKNVKKYLEEN